eukprot:COSAG02_NODE_4930_length_4820_cov_633.956789_4_plen_70_part_00
MLRASTWFVLLRLLLSEVTAGAHSFDSYVHLLVDLRCQLSLDESLNRCSPGIFPHFLYAVLLPFARIVT